MFIDSAATCDEIVSGTQPPGGEELRKAIILFNMFMIDSGSRYHQHESGFLDPKSWEARLKIFPEIVSLPVYEAWRSSIGARSHSEDFLELLDKLAGRSAGRQAS